MGEATRKLKEGEVLRYKSGFLGKKWKECWAVLFSDSEFVWYDKKGDSRPAGSVFLKDVVPYTCVGPMCDRMPVRRPELPQRYSLYHLVGIGMDPQASKVHWFLFSSDSDLESWFTEIMKTLPKPNPPPPGAQQPAAAGGTGVPPPAYNPPPVYPSGPPPVANTYPSQPAYVPQTQYGGGAPVYGASGPAYGSGGGGGTTVIVTDRGGGDYGSRYGGGYGGSSGPGLGTGMLMGSLLGFGLGSMWGGGLHSGFGMGGFGYPSYGMGSGFGGGYVQDNDTYITNNYYGDGPAGGGAIPGSGDTPAITDVTDTAGGHDMIEDQHGGYDVGGGDDYGGYDVGGGDDFGGGMDDFGGDGGDYGGGGDW